MVSTELPRWHAQRRPVTLSFCSDHRHMELKEIKTNDQNHYPGPTPTLWIQSATVFTSRAVDVPDF